MAILSLILDSSGIDSDSTSLLFRRLVNVCVVLELGTVLLGEVLGDGSSQGGLTVIDVTYRKALGWMSALRKWDLPMVPTFK